MNARNLLLFFAIAGTLFWLGTRHEAKPPAPPSTVLTTQQEKTLQAAHDVQQTLDQAHSQAMQQLGQPDNTDNTSQ